MELMSGVDATHKLDPRKRYALCGVDAWENVDDWHDVNCWECRAIADVWDGVSLEDMEDVNVW